MKRVFLVVSAVLLAAPLNAQSRSALAVRADGQWRSWWRSDAAPVHWEGAHATVVHAVRWRVAAPGVEWGELRLRGSGEAWRIRAVVVRLDPARLGVALEQAVRDAGLGGAWSVDSAPPKALVALNAGQFSAGTPWGWLVRNGEELAPPGSGALASALVVDREGGARIVPAESIAAIRARGEAMQAFQSYPALLHDGRIPLQLQAPGRGVDLGHRDSRLAVGQLADGRLIVVLTRFEGLGGVLEELPFGPTVPEMAALLGALGARDAMLLDGGISGQLLVRAGDRTHAWRGMRRVPLALLFHAK